MSREVIRRWLVISPYTGVQKLTPDFTYKDDSGLEVTWQLSLRPYDEASRKPIILNPNQPYQYPSLLELKIIHCNFAEFRLGFKLQVLQKGQSQTSSTLLAGIDRGFENATLQRMFKNDHLCPCSPQGNLYWIIFNNSANVAGYQVEIVFTIKTGTGIGQPTASDKWIRDCEFHSKFWNMYEENTETDASIIVKTDEVKEFKVHWIVMEARSPVLAAMFKHECLEKEKRKMVIVDFSVSVIEKFIKFLYTGECDVQDEFDVVQLLACADKYDVQNLKSKCQEVLAESLSAQNAVHTLQMAHLHCADSLKDAALKFIKDHHKEIAKTEDWKSMTNDLLNDVINFVLG